MRENRNNRADVDLAAWQQPTTNDEVRRSIVLRGRTEGR
jgi:hypothetical protein